MRPINDSSTNDTYLERRNAQTKNKEQKHEQRRSCWRSLMMRERHGQAGQAMRVRKNTACCCCGSVETYSAIK